MAGSDTDVDVVTGDSLEEIVLEVSISIAGEVVVIDSRVVNQARACTQTAFNTVCFHLVGETLFCRS